MAIAVVPPTVSVAPGGTQAFAANCVTVAGDTVPAGAPVVWHATGGTITPDGLYTAGQDSGDFGVTASSADGSALPGRASVSVARTAVFLVAVHPDTATLPVQGSRPLHVTMFDAAGDSLPPSAQVTWTSSDPTVVAVDATGLVMGMAPGTATVTAGAQGKTGSALITVVPPGSGPWPNEPPGFTVISDQPWNVLTSLAWSLQFGTAAIGIDPTAPLSPPNVLQIVYPVGFEGGSAPGTMIHDLGPSGVRQLYAGVWWKPSNPWQGHASSNVNKIEFVFPAEGGDIYLAMYGRPGGPFELRVLPQFLNLPVEWLVPNVNHVPVTLDAWHKIEWLLVYNTTTSPANGIVRWWLDGQLIGDYFNVQFPAGPLGYFKISPTWGGGGEIKTETDYFWYDHVHLSGR